MSGILDRLKTKIVNAIARGVVQLVDDAKKLQLVQLGVLAGEDVDDAEHVEPYGFTSVPLAGAEAVVVFPNGDRGHALVIACPDRRYRPTGGRPGEVTMYAFNGAYIRITKDGDILVSAAPGRDVLLNDGAGTPEALVKKSEFDGHTHAPGASMQAGGDPVTGNTAGAAAVTGTTSFKAE